MGEDAAVARYAAEFLGTYILVLSVGCNVLSGQPVWGGVSIACALTVMIYALGKSSGANFNPAVSLALGLNSSLPWKDVGIYMVVQVLGGILAGFTYLAIFSQAFNLAPTDHHTMIEAALAEFFYTFMLCFVVLNVAVSKKHAGIHQFYGLAIGFVVVAGAYGGGSISMGCFNPAVAFGIDVSSAHLGFGYCIFYTIFEFIGAAAATVAFWMCRPDEDGVKFKIAEMDGSNYPLASRLISEFLGTFMLVLTVGLNVLSGSTAGAFSIAASLMCMIYALGSCSGAHFNPAVTVAILAAGRDKISAQDAGLYMLVQVIGGMCAANTYVFMMGGKSFQLKPNTIGFEQALPAEFCFTFVLAFVVLSVATVKSPLTHYFGFAIGMCVTVGGCAIGKISGGSLNPAVSLGIASSHSLGFSNGIAYTFVEVLAGLLAAVAFQITQPSEYETEVNKPLAGRATVEKA